jgi:hypothetical protein
MDPHHDRLTLPRATTVSARNSTPQCYDTIELIALNLWVVSDRAKFGHFGFRNELAEVREHITTGDGIDHAGN